MRVRKIYLHRGRQVQSVLREGGAEGNGVLQWHGSGRGKPEKWAIMNRPTPSSHGPDSPRTATASGRARSRPQAAWSAPPLPACSLAAAGSPRPATSGVHSRARAQPRRRCCHCQYYALAGEVGAGRRRYPMRSGWVGRGVLPAPVFFQSLRLFRGIF